MSNVRIKVANKIADIVERRDYRIKRAKAKQLLRHLGLAKKAADSTDVSNILNTITGFVAKNPCLSIGTGIGLTTGGIGLSRKKKRKALDYLTYLGGGALAGGGIGFLLDRGSDLVKNWSSDKNTDKSKNIAKIDNSKYQEAQNYLSNEGYVNVTPEKIDAICKHNGCEPEDLAAILSNKNKPAEELTTGFIFDDEFKKVTLGRT